MAKLSTQMREVLKLARDGRPLDANTRGRSGYGGLSNTVMALRRRGLLDGDKITPAGVQALDITATLVKP